MRSELVQAAGFFSDCAEKGAKMNAEKLCYSGGVESILLPHHPRSFITLEQPLKISFKSEEVKIPVRSTFPLFSSCVWKNWVK